MTHNRRQILANAIMASALLTVPGLTRAATARTRAGPPLSPQPHPSQPYAPPAGPRSRLIFVNDLSGDIDGLFAAVHAILSPTSQLRAIVGTGTGRPGETARRSTELAREILSLMPRHAAAIAVQEGAPAKLSDIHSPIRSAGTQAIIDEALRTDTSLPLYVAVGGGLTEVASALLLEPRIADRMTLVWIGGDAYPAGGTGETNFNIDPLAAQYIFNESRVPIWQIPRAVYGTCLVSDTEIQAHVAPHGRIGAWLYARIFEAAGRFNGAINVGETWCLGDNPLVVLTALHDWVPSVYRPTFRYERNGSSPSEEVFAPLLNRDGTFTPRTDGRKVRIFTAIDNRLMLGDFFAKMQVNFPA
ncbi:nucleoside hydrolase [Sphingobium sufflavum]|uniref:nucleoside hydrolase n=1 Tax=Sphingobium sufflavum TaxID=1129547 RepID=UPI001F3BED79|nr:nucleoside hydrolase [Sphingobium sufflavum]MCE7798663.1 nucleoside hydrolase [Sphingobium sufflavum]